MMTVGVCGMGCWVAEPGCAGTSLWPADHMLGEHLRHVLTYSAGRCFLYVRMCARFWWNIHIPS